MQDNSAEKRDSEGWHMAHDGRRLATRLEGRLARDVETALSNYRFSTRTFTTRTARYISAFTLASQPRQFMSINEVCIGEPRRYAINPGPRKEGGYTEPHLREKTNPEKNI